MKYKFCCNMLPIKQPQTIFVQVLSQTNPAYLYTFYSLQSMVIRNKFNLVKK